MLTSTKHTVDIHLLKSLSSLSMHTHTHTHTHTHMHAHTYTRTSHTHTYTHACISSHMHGHIPEDTTVVTVPQPGLIGATEQMSQEEVHRRLQLKAEELKGDTNLTEVTMATIDYVN